MKSTKQVAMDLEAKFVTRVKKLSLQFTASFFSRWKKYAPTRIIVR